MEKREKNGKQKNLAFVFCTMKSFLCYIDKWKINKKSSQKNELQSREYFEARRDEDKIKVKRDIKDQRELDVLRVTLNQGHVV